MASDDLRHLVIASTNAGKITEFASLLASLPVRVLRQPERLQVDENGTTFAENARLKAVAVAKATCSWALADDSGLSVQALDGAPGVHSARYAETDGSRIERLLRELADVNERRRSLGLQPDRFAHFTAALAVADADGEILLEVEGICPGRILESPRGRLGFGYDPVFFVPEVGMSFAEMDPAIKSSIGHRGRAFALLEPRLRQLLLKPSSHRP